MRTGAALSVATCLMRERSGDYGVLTGRGFEARVVTFHSFAPSGPAQDKGAAELLAILYSPRLRVDEHGEVKAGFPGRTEPPQPGRRIEE